MIGFAVALCAGFFLCLKFRPRKVDEMDRVFAEELQRIKNDSAPNFIDTEFGRKNFELFGEMRFSVAANDEARISYPVTSLQDLTPQDLA